MKDASSMLKGGKQAPVRRLVILGNSFESFGMVIDFTSKRDPFINFALGPLAAAVRLQLRHEHHVAVVEDKKLVGYMGWLPTTTESAQLWLDDKGSLTPKLDGDTDAYAVTVVASEDAALMRSMIRHARDRYPGRKAYFKRTDADGTGRKGSVGVFTEGALAPELQP